MMELMVMAMNKSCTAENANWAVMETLKNTDKTGPVKAINITGIGCIGDSEWIRQIDQGSRDTIRFPITINEFLRTMEPLKPKSVKGRIKERMRIR